MDNMITEAMKTNGRLYSLIYELVNYAISHSLIEPEDEKYAINRLLDVFDLDEINEKFNTGAEERPLSRILDEMLDLAASRKLLDGGSITSRDLFDTKIMGELTPRPSAVIKKWRELYRTSPEAATDMHYELSCATNYIRTDRIARDIKWTHSSEYGEIDITVNLSKPEKDPRAIAAARLLPQVGYPRCALCHDNEGYRGTLDKAARQTLRQIPLTLGGEPWLLQYSPYVYYNEHCIVLAEEHRPMKIERGTFVRLLDFITALPHYFIGSNADLKIVGGSILSHDHMQGGRYTFAMERAPIKTPLSFDGYQTVRAGIVKWPMSVIRLCSSDKAALVELADAITTAWRGWTDEAAMIFAYTDGEPHNTVTPIARRRGEEYEIDVVLRNNLTTEEHPLGLYHPHAEHHSIKKENIGLIEVMGLAVLPSRLKGELAELRSLLISKKEIPKDSPVAKHGEWLAAFRDEYEFTEENTEQILRAEVGKTFVRVLKDAGVYKDDEAGLEAFMRFISSLNGKKI